MKSAAVNIDKQADNIKIMLHNLTALKIKQSSEKK